MAENGVGNRRAAWRIIASPEPKNEPQSAAYRDAVVHRPAVGRIVTSVQPEANEQQAASPMEVVIKVEDELQKFRHGILALMDKNLVSSATTEESKMSYYAMVGDYYRYLAELAAVEAKSKAAKDACEADTEATKIAEKLIDKDVPVVLQRQVPMIQHVHRCSTMTRSSVCLL